MIFAVSLPGCSIPPWRNFEERYRTREGPPANGERAEAFVVYTSGDRVSVRSPAKVIQAFADDSVYLGFSGVPALLQLVHPVKIPLAAVTACTRSPLSSELTTNLWLAEARTDIGFPDKQGRILEWCKAHSIPIVDRQTVLEWLHPDSDESR